MEDIKVEDSILLSIKKQLGSCLDTDHFDPDVIITINGALNILTQLGVGPVEGFSISSSQETWKDFVGDDKRLKMVTTYVYLKAKLVFDPPTTGAVLEVCKELIKEYEWRINVQVDPPYTFD